MYCKAIFFLVNDTSFASDKHLPFRCNLIEKKIKSHQFKKQDD